MGMEADPDGNPCFYIMTEDWDFIQVGLDNPVKHTNYTDVKFTGKDLFAFLATCIFLGGVYLLTRGIGI